MPSIRLVTGPPMHSNVPDVVHQKRDGSDRLAVPEYRESFIEKLKRLGIAEM